MARVTVDLELPDGWVLSGDPPHICCYEHRQDTSQFNGPWTAVDPAIELGAHPPFMVVPIMWSDEKAAANRARAARVPVAASGEVSDGG